MQEKIIEFISAKTGVPKESITRETDILSLGLDSMKFLFMIMEFEKEFSVSVSDTDISKLVTVDDIINLVENKSDK